MAGIVIGPFTPGYVADPKLAAELAEIGVILLMFGVGLHFSPQDLLAVRAIAVPGAVAQIALATILGLLVGLALGWSLGAGLVFGLALSVASTVVLLRALQERSLIDTDRGRIAVGWLIVEDLAMVVTLVLVPPLAALLGGSQIGIDPNPEVTTRLGVGPVVSALLVTAVKIGAFGIVMLIAGRKVIPWILHYVAHTGSREMFRLSVLAIALGLAFGSAYLFGVSFALGAFFAGMVLAESALSQQAANETLPLRDAFAVLFFVSVGMLFDPGVLVAHPVAVLVTFLIIVVGKSAVAYGIVRAFGHTRNIALTIAASLAQIGEFSFILIVLGLSLGIVPDTARDLIVAGSLLSIFVNPFVFRIAERLHADKGGAQTVVSEPVAPSRHADVEPETAIPIAGHAILIGYGELGREIAAGLLASSVPFVVIEDWRPAIEQLVARGIKTVHGHGGDPAVLEQANLAGARWLIVAVQDVYEAGLFVETARAANPAIRILGFAQGAQQCSYLRSLGGDVILAIEPEIARGILREILSPAGGVAASA
jgi:CPA2 family monovalent cation:H+ antiporter-2